MPQTRSRRMRASLTSSPASPSSISLSTSELSPPSSANTTAPEEPSDWDMSAAAAPSPSRLLEPNKARGQQPHHHRGHTSPNTLPKKSDSMSHSNKHASPKRATEARADTKERSQSPRKTDRGDRSQAGTTTPRRDPEAGVSRQPSRGQDEGQRRSGGQQHPSSNPASGEGTQGGERRRSNQEEDPTRRQERESEGWGTSESRRKDRGANPSDTRGSTSSAAIQEHTYNGNPSSKKPATITPGPWKVPSSAKIHPHAEGN
ncbi:unnamed protein product [Oncorhynchus mykiss]|uniref:Uncharacterized protein n=1 Tax=Oncorhynchus mykiss TaxID=8022 RepID=A0A060X7X3_ONCMY|nr:unnamed protein product [Oncorhynchus mykiss]